MNDRKHILKMIKDTRKEIRTAGTTNAELIEDVH
jgi:hypothetical protein